MLGIESDVSEDNRANLLAAQVWGGGLLLVCFFSSKNIIQVVFNWHA